MSAHGALHLLRASGRLYGANLNGTTRRHRHLFAVNQRFDYARNPAQEFGGQSVEAGIYSRWRLSEHSGLRTQLFVDAIVLGAMDATVAGTGLRGYDFGPGLGVRTEVAFERKGVTWLRSWARSEVIHSVSGAPADHEASFGGFEAVVPLLSLRRGAPHRLLPPGEPLPRQGQGSATSPRHACSSAGPRWAATPLVGAP
ncbi:MAG: hypothetical protein IPG75_15375 [Gemmatimonadetes bacterium]|nr:hypothetical protein [Gemmatimonadota bacterium]